MSLAAVNQVCVIHEAMNGCKYLKGNLWIALKMHLIYRILNRTGFVISTFPVSATAQKKNDYIDFNPYKTSVLFVRPRQTVQTQTRRLDATSDQGIHCLLTECSIKI